MAKKLEEIKEEECPYDLPEGWKWERLGNEIVLVSGQDVPSKECNEVGNGVPYVMGASNIENSKFSATRWIENPRVISLRNDILISVKGTVGKLYIQKEDVLNISRQIMAIRVKENIANKYMFNFLVHFNDNLKTSANGLIPGISRDVLLKTIIPLPPKETQQNIVDIIESLFAKLDIAQEKVEWVLSESENRRSAILHKAFSGELTEKWREENGVSFDSWKKSKISDIFSLKAGKTMSAKNINDVCDERHKYKCYGGNGIRGYVEKFNKDGEHPIIGRQGALCGNIHLAKGKFYATEHAVVVDYLYNTDTMWAVENLRFLNLNQYSTSVAQPGLAVKKIMEVPITFPTYEEQREIGKLLSKLLSVEERVKSTCQSTLETIATMRKSILAKAFRGELCS